MALLDKLPQSPYGLKGQTPSNLASATAAGDLHFDPKTKGHRGGHTDLELGGTPSRYTDNLPK